MDFLKFKNYLPSNADYNEWTNMLQLKIFQKKTRNIYKFVKNKTKICLFCYKLIFVMKLKLKFQSIVFISHNILSENLLNETKKLNSKEILNLFWDLNAIFSNSRTLAFFQWLTHLKKTYKIICKFLMG